MFVPVSVTAVTDPTVADAGDADRISVPTLMVLLMAPSETVKAPVPAPVDTTMVAEVVPFTVWLILDVPSTPDTVKFVPAVQLVPAPVRVSVRFPGWLAGIAVGVTIMLLPLICCSATIAPAPVTEDALSQFHGGVHPNAGE